MSLDFDLICSIHRLLRQQSDLNDRISRGPRRVKITQATEKKINDDLVAAKDAMTRTRMLVDEKQLQLNSREAKIEDLKAKLNTCASNKEYQLLSDQIAADEQASSVLADEILEQLEKLDNLMADHELAKANLAKAVVETKKIESQVEAELAQLNSELERVTAERTAAETSFPLVVKKEYLRLVAAHGELALASTDKQTCGNCSQMLSTQIVNQLLLKEPVFCQGCGSLMYLEESTAASS